MIFMKNLFLQILSLFLISSGIIFGLEIRKVHIIKPSVPVFLEDPSLCHPRAGGDPENKREMSYYVYILNSKRNVILHV